MPDLLPVPLKKYILPIHISQKCFPKLMKVVSFNIYYKVIMLWIRTQGRMLAPWKCSMSFLYWLFWCTKWYTVNWYSTTWTTCPNYCLFALSLLKRKIKRLRISESFRSSEMDTMPHLIAVNRMDEGTGMETSINDRCRFTMDFLKSFKGVT